MSTQPDSTPPATAEAPDKGVGCDALFGLWVVGESTPDPEQWSIWSEWSLVIARNEAEALSLSDGRRTCCRIPMNAPLHLVTMSEPNHGEDI